ncbi:uncharacterized protein LY89DRAFT_740966 [Mollisia scopiformis]|uniref:Uncharacterized protein n=1 Tax=Mollisia scopiformis TaxID=149040 RepID=A0A132BA11_MOLSC|nr:uncharacterized protein LY89DRAFT_740966 [Mollisia scopiformis]KUJ09238.1 hypothetical protein LY89DRAFT_740966 [Mollisia scopiformis]
MPANGKPSTGRFELPQLTPVNFSLTDGTNIPPPPASPIEEKAPAVAPESASNGAAAAPPATNGQSATATNANGAYEGRGRTNVSIEQQPTSPVSTKRPSSIRRFLSRKSLNTNYTNGTNSNLSNEDVTMIDRPESAMSFASTRPSIAKKKSGGWFRRFSSSGAPNPDDRSPSRASIIYEDKQSTPKPMGPPPPKLPELSKLRAKIPDNDDGSLGAEDMFKNIK